MGCDAKSTKCTSDRNRTKGIGEESNPMGGLDLTMVHTNALVVALMDKADLPKSKAQEVVNILQNLG